MFYLLTYTIKQFYTGLSKNFDNDIDIITIHSMVILFCFLTQNIIKTSNISICFNFNLDRNLCCLLMRIVCCIVAGLYTISLAKTHFYIQTVRSFYLVFRFVQSLPFIVLLLPCIGGFRSWS